MLRWRLALSVGVLLAPFPLLAQAGAAHPTPPRLAAASRADGSISVDARLDEADWRVAQPVADFVQTQPADGAPATQRTEIRFLLDDGALYIGARMFDPLGPAGVRSRLMRRDGSADGDKLTITFDSYHDHQGTAEFSINPSGVKGDALNGDTSWDPVWEASSRIDSLGWIAEIRIPLAQLRFPRESDDAWGLQVVRFSQRLNEQSQWVYWKQNESGGAIRYGHLSGMRIAASPGKAEVLPYVVGRSSNLTVNDPANPFTHPHALDYRTGLDAKVLLTSNLTLSATINPDFGQVEVDPAVVNLSAFETSFSEKRPFFIEGSGLFRFGGLNCFTCSNASGLQMLYTRRMGRQPQGAGNAFTRGPYADIPENTTILGAAKLTGRTSKGWSIGIMDAATRRERAPVQALDGSRSSVEVEPFTNYLIARGAKDLRGGNTQVRSMVTSVVRDLNDSMLIHQLNSHAEGYGLDTDHWWGKRTYRFMGTLAASSISGSPDAILRAQRSSARYFQRPDRDNGGNGLFTNRFDSTLTSMRGFATYARVSKEGGNVQFELQNNVRSPGFEVNDASFLTRADYIWFAGNVRWRKTTVTSVSRYFQLLVGGQRQYNFDGDLNDGQVHGSIFWRMLNFWETSLYFQHRPDLLDERMTRGGPVVMRPGINYLSYSLSTDSRKPLVASTNPYISQYRDGGSEQYVNLSVTYRPAPNLSLSLGPTYNRVRTSAQYVTSVADLTATAFYGRRYVFGALDQRTISMDTRFNITFTPTLTLELYAQPLISSADYSDYKEFIQPRSLPKAIYGRDRGTIQSASGVYTVDPDGAGPAAQFTFREPDFNFRSLRGNAVLRWEYRPGSTLYFVWTQSRSIQAPVGDLSLNRDVGALFDAPTDNIFLVKVSYWLGF